MEYLSSIRGIYYNRLISTIIILAACAAMFFFVRMAVKIPKWPKLVYAIWAVVTVFIAVFTVKGVVDLHYDIKEESYVVYRGEFIIRGGGQKSPDTIVIYDDSGKEIKLLSGRIVIGDGHYTGEVMYGRRSKIVAKITIE